jgi:hypothetical protein
VTLKIDMGDLGGRVLFALADGSETTNTLTGSLNAITLKLPAAGTAVLLPVAQATGTVSGSQTVALKPDPVDGLRLTLPNSKALRALVPRWYEPSPDSPLHYSPQLFTSSEKSLLDFFGTCDTIASLSAVPIVTRPGATREEHQAAEAVQEYFRFYSEEVLSKPRVVMPIVTEAQGRQVRIVVRRSPSVGLDATGAILTIQAPSEELLDTTRGLLELLDRRFPFYGQIGRWVHQRPKETALRQKLGLAGGTVLSDGSIVTTPVGASLWNSVEKGPAYGKPW